ncbi:tyrosine-type recombinase/integrase [Streptomyces tendae]|uniref:tyrosine-type recombinase/integrase n=1 Tax=Streptomyces tendae TaxID=1932 RepID=UPI0033E92B4E
MWVEVMEEEWLYSQEEVRALLDWVREHEVSEPAIYPFMWAMGELALRQGEAQRLRVGDAFLPAHGHGNLAVRHKGRTRTVPLRPRAVEFLEEWIRESGAEEGDLLFSDGRGRALSGPVCQQAWEQAQKAVLERDERYTWRLGEPIDILRESRLVRWLQSGVSCFAVAEVADVTASWLAMRYPHCFRMGDSAIDWGYLGRGDGVAASVRS